MGMLTVRKRGALTLTRPAETLFQALGGRGAGSDLRVYCALTLLVTCAPKRVAGRPSISDTVVQRRILSV
jgi:hypothetical protein